MGKIGKGTGSFGKSSREEVDRREREDGVPRRETFAHGDWARARQSERSRLGPLGRAVVSQQPDSPPRVERKKETDSLEGSKGVRQRGP